RQLGLLPSGPHRRKLGFRRHRSNSARTPQRAWVDSWRQPRIVGQEHQAPAQGLHRGAGLDVVAFREYLVTLRKLVADAQAQRKSGEALADAVMPALSDKYGRWDFFKYEILRGHTSW